MKNIIKIKKSLLILVCYFISVSLWSQTNLNTAQRQLQNDVISFLKNEGFQPSIDDDGDVSFKKEGVSFFIRILSNSPFLLRISHYITITNYNKLRALLVGEEVNKYYGIKVGFDTIEFEVLGAKSVVNQAVIRFEMYLGNIDYFKQMFSKAMDQMQLASKEFREDYNNSNYDPNKYR